MAYQLHSILVMRQAETAIDTTHKNRAFEDLARPFISDLRLRALWYSHDATESEDLVQETLLRAYTGFGTFIPGTCFRSWLLRILHNVFVSRYRRTRMESTWLSKTCEVEEALHEGAVLQSRQNPERKTAERALDEAVAEALDRLSPEYRQVLELRCLSGRSYRAIAKTLNCPTGTVMSRLHRARAQLREEVMGRLALQRKEQRHSEGKSGVVDACLLAA